MCGGERKVREREGKKRRWENLDFHKIIYFSLHDTQSYIFEYCTTLHKPLYISVTDV